MQKILTVEELNLNIKKYLENIDYFKTIYVRGEISNLNINQSGHVYFSIKDQNAAINCMIWKNNASKLIKLNPTEGTQVTCVGRLTYYVLGGRIAFEVRDVQLDGIGELQKIYDQRFQQLKQAGWFDKSIKKNLPNIVNNVGIVTADTGAAIHDLISTIHRRMPSMNIYLFPSQVQGNQAQYDIANKIKQANNCNIKLDVLIVGRGGGSYEDLWCFNEMPVLQAIKESNIPIVSAIGHQPDITLSDYIADISVATPTAAGELVSKDINELKNQLKHYFNNIKILINNKILNWNQDLKHLKKQLVNNISGLIKSKQDLFDHTQDYLPVLMNSKIEHNFRNLSSFKKLLIQGIQRKLYSCNLDINKVSNELTSKINNRLQDCIKDFNYTISYFKGLINQKLIIHEMEVDQLTNTLNLLNPKKPLENGFSITTDISGKRISSYKQINKNDKLKIFLQDGKIITNVEEVIKNER